MTDCGNRAGSVLFPRQIRGLVTMGKVIDEAGDRQFEREDKS